MYKIKLFRNMSVLVAGQSIKQVLTNRDWWKGVFGNMFSTMLGIALTVGVAALVEHHNNKKQSREMMFNIVKTCEDNSKTIAEFDSLFQTHEKSIVKIYDIYYATGKFEKDISKEQVDTLSKCLQNLKNFDHIFYSYVDVSKYFYNAQLMHQFGNAEKYSKFAKFVQFDRYVAGNIDSLIGQWKSIFTDFSAKILNDNKTDGASLAALIDEHRLTEYLMAIRFAMLSQMTKAYQDYMKDMLEVMGATKEDYEEYKKSIDTGVHGTHTYKTKT